MISFVVCGVSMLSRASSAPDSPGSGIGHGQHRILRQRQRELARASTCAAARKAWCAWRSR